MTPNTNNKIKICFIATYTYALFHPGECDLPITGLDVQLFNWAKAFSNNCMYEVNFIVGDFGQSKKEVIGGVTLWKSSMPKKRGILSGAISFFKVLKNFRQIGADVYIDRGASGPISFEIAILCVILRKKYIHMLASDEDVNGGYEKKSGFILKIIYLLSLHFADVVTSQNAFQHEILEKRKIKSCKVVNSFPIGQERFFKKDSILWVGSSYALKRPEIFLDLAKYFPKERFVMILQEHDKNVFLSVKDSIIDIPNVEFYPGIPFHKINSYFQEAKVFINTSIFEGFPNTFIQATVNSVPIISLKVNPDDIFKEGGIGICCDDDARKLKNELKKMIENSKRLKKLSKNARVFALNNFDINANITIFDKMIKKVLCL